MSLDTLGLHNNLEIPRPTSKAVVTFEASEKDEADNPAFILTRGKRGIIVLPGGGIENDENDLEALVREIDQELGVVLDPEEIEQPFLKHSYEIGEGQTANAVVRKVKLKPKTPLKSKEKGTEILTLTLDQLTDPRERYIEAMGALTLFALNKYIDLPNYTSDSRN